jgi:hypothetical protein
MCPFIASVAIPIASQKCTSISCPSDGENLQVNFALTHRGVRASVTLEVFYKSSRAVSVIYQAAVLVCL